MNDLYQFINGPWLSTHVIPEDRGYDGNFFALRDASEEQVHELIKDAPGRPGILYRSFMDTDSINAAGVAPLDADFDRLAVKDTRELARVFGELDREGVGAPVAFYVSKDTESENEVAYVLQSGLGLPDEAYYREEAHQETLAAYAKHVLRMLQFLDPARLFGLPADAAAARIVALETEIARGHWDVVASRDAVKTNNPAQLSELPAHAQEILRGAGLPDGRVIVSQHPTWST